MYQNVLLSLRDVEMLHVKYRYCELLKCSAPYVEYHLLTFYCVPPVGYRFAKILILGVAGQS